MKKAKKLTASLLAALSLGAAGVPFTAAPPIAFAQEVSPAADYQILYLGPGLPLRVFTEMFSLPDWNKRQSRSGIRFSQSAGELTMLESALEDYTERNREEAEANGLTTVKTLYVHRADSRILSFAESTAAYSGGMRGRYGIFGRNYDTAEGRELTLEDVFTDRELLAREIARRLLDTYGTAELPAADVPALTNALLDKMEHNGVHWTLEPRGASFYMTFRHTRGGPECTICTASILFGEAPVFREKYTIAPEEWCLEMEPGIPLRLQIGEALTDVTTVSGDGQQVIITRGKASPQNGGQIQGEEVFRDPGELSVARAVYLNLRDGRRYLYVDCHLRPDRELYSKKYAPGEEPDFAVLENQHELRVYDLSGDTVQPVPFEGRFTLLASDPANPDFREWLVLTNPRSFLLNRTDEPLESARVRCRVSEDGSPEVMGSEPSL